VPSESDSVTRHRSNICAATLYGAGGWSSSVSGQIRRGMVPHYQIGIDIKKKSDIMTESIVNIFI
jgi:hypothetical protein